MASAIVDQRGLASYIKKAAEEKKKREASNVQEAAPEAHGPSQEAAPEAHGPSQEAAPEAHDGPSQEDPGQLWPGTPSSAGEDAPSFQDFATKNQVAYMVFVQQHVREGPKGPEVTLSNSMCQDPHVEDLLGCIEAWCLRKYGASGVPWLGSLDLSKNGLSDESVARIVERLGELSVRVHSLDLSSNKAGAKGLSALEAYLRNCPEPFHEISLADNEITAEAVSSLLRCLYKHESYPRKSGLETHPLVLRLSGNNIDLSRMRKDIQQQVGQKARFCWSPEAYKADSEEFLSVYVADFLKVLHFRNFEPPPFRREHTI